MGHLFFKVAFKGYLRVQLVLQFDQSGNRKSILFADTLKFELAFPQSLEPVRIEINI